MTITQITVDYSVAPIVRTRQVTVKPEVGPQEKWELTGECNQCGECCKHFPSVAVAENIKVLPCGTCEMLKKNVDGNGVVTWPCRAYWGRPVGCALFPSNPYHELPKECSFEWKRVE